MEAVASQLTEEDLLIFEEEIKQAFLAAKIRAPVHLSGGNERALIRLFKFIHTNDWVFSTYRSHYHALLKGIPRQWLLQEILAGRSMHIFNAEYRFLSSAIVGGCLSQAVGLALGLMHKGTSERVWCIVGDMAAETGIFYEAAKYTARNGLTNLTFVVEDNGLSTNTPTQVAWGRLRPGFTGPQIAGMYGADVKVYTYERTVPHVGAGQWVTFT